MVQVCCFIIPFNSFAGLIAKFLLHTNTHTRSHKLYIKLTYGAPTTAFQLQYISMMAIPQGCFQVMIMLGQFNHPDKASDVVSCV